MSASNAEAGGRIIGIRPRVKKTTMLEARPTQVFILYPDGREAALELPDTEAETDFIAGILPVVWRGVKPEDSVKDLPFISHGMWEEVDEEQAAKRLPQHLVRTKKGRKKVAIHALTKVPVALEGLRSGDKVAMVLGAGNAFALTIAERGIKIGCELFRCPTKVPKDHRGEEDTKDEDAKLLATLLSKDPSLFYLMEERHQQLTRVAVAFRDRYISMQRRIRVLQQRLQQARDEAILSGARRTDPATSIEDTLMATAKAHPDVLDEEEIEKEFEEKLAEALEKVPVWNEILEPIEGMGVSIGARIIAAAQDIRRFEVKTDAQAKAESYAREHEHEKLGRFEEDIHLVADKLKSDSTRFQILQLVRSAKRAAGKEEEAVLLDQALEEYALRRKLRMHSESKGANKMKAYLGVHLMMGGKYADWPEAKQFPSRRNIAGSGRPANWQQIGRQGLYLFAKQTEYRPSSEWGAKRKVWKGGIAERKQPLNDAALAQAEAEGKENARIPWPKARINKASGWRTASRFVEWLFRTWLDWERKQAELLKPRVYTSHPWWTYAEFLALSKQGPVSNSDAEQAA